MANLEKLVCSWNGLPGGTGNTVIYWKAGNSGTIRPAWISFVNSWVTLLPPSVGVTIPPNGEVIDESTGKMVNVWSAGTVATVVGTATATAYSPSTGAQVKWLTNDFANGRAVRGRTFIVPCTAGVYTSGGILTQSFCNIVQAAATTFISGSSSNFVVWSRPVYDHTVDPPVLKRPGSTHVVTSSTVPTKVASLKGRRDT